ncbi:MAG: flagellar FlbD family protein [Phyllobacterium sp.]|uniref:flagellar FlbD family protein n=1 Tax=Phyllobacterium sp. TaxID=1871046 RepID=UPI0030F0A32D
MWIKLTDVNGDHITVNFNHVVSFNPYGTGTHIVTTTAGLTFFVKETIEEIQSKVGITAT